MLSCEWRGLVLIAIAGFSSVGEVLAWVMYV